MPDDKTRGLYDKYRVERTDDKHIDGCIVLEYKDPIARVGILAWAREMRAKGYHQVYEDVIAELVRTYPIKIKIGDTFWLDDAQWWEVIGMGNDGQSFVELQKLTNETPSRKRHVEKRALIGVIRYFVEFPSLNPTI